MTPPESAHFGDELRLLKDRVTAMGQVAEHRVPLALQGLMQRDRDALDDVIAGDDRLNQAQIEIDDHCFQLLALFQPVAVELRVVVSALRINTDLERVGDLAVNLAEAGQRYMTHPPVKPLVDLPRMGDLALTMLRDALAAFVSRDTVAAYSVLRQDDWLDVLNNQIMRELMTYMLGNSQVIERCFMTVDGSDTAINREPIDGRRSSVQRCRRSRRAPASGPRASARPG